MKERAAVRRGVLLGTQVHSTRHRRKRSTLATAHLDPEVFKSCINRFKREVGRFLRASNCETGEEKRVMWMYELTPLVRQYLTQICVYSYKIF